MRLNPLTEFVILFEPTELRGMKYAIYVAILVSISIIIGMHGIPSSVGQLEDILMYDTTTFILVTIYSILGMLGLLAYQKTYFGKDKVTYKEVTYTVYMALLAVMTVYAGTMLLLVFIDYLTGLINIPVKLVMYIKIIAIPLYLFLVKDFFERTDYNIK